MGRVYFRRVPLVGPVSHPYLHRNSVVVQERDFLCFLSCTASQSWISRTAESRESGSLPAARIWAFFSPASICFRGAPPYGKPVWLPSGGGKGPEGACLLRRIPLHVLSVLCRSGQPAPRISPLRRAPLPPRTGILHSLIVSWSFAGTPLRSSSVLACRISSG